ncbi:hypothetical protein H9L10_03625 [Phycicoccus endophyticus]|uniref:Uncharacterized protein n=1 Tax=Phycicoccus endophyticus TaxID=1690220 RepID=A0A7G9R3I4_9MICO|nr:hypothetical protein [Phycicoccus endophyticus]NHI19915.1 hypothetical protein [Phycicoccus endophyticus]QNN50159.1 hypothetical protein H9L10_03625 [Phycicoccus endophyticus]GGL27557.1 hypothetical protein GCM10012283_07180 [Phycicoccus endophyticus]
MSRTVWSMNRDDLVAALRQARVEAATAQAVLARVEAERATRLARRREARAAAREKERTLTQAATASAAHTVPLDPMAAYHRWVLEQALTDPRPRQELHR